MSVISEINENIVYSCSSFRLCYELGVVGLWGCNREHIDVHSPTNTNNTQQQQQTNKSVPTLYYELKHAHIHTL